jgi:GT2 family glycosyltransferase
MNENPKIAAVIVTFNRKKLLKECLKSLLNQTIMPDEIIVIDNASTDGTDQMIGNEFPQVTYVRLSENIGGAGGFHEGMKVAYGKGYDWIWVMDDDAFPVPTALEKLMACSKEADILVPVLVDSLGRRYGAGRWQFGYIPINLDYDVKIKIVPIEMFSFVGPLFRREVVARIGFPREDFFICADDLEWALRAKMAGFVACVVLDSVIFHESEELRILRRLGRISIRNSQPPWKHYYSTRNMFLMLNHFKWFKRNLEKIALFYRVVRWSLGDILYEPDWQQRIYFRWLGVLHGLLGKTGKVVVPSRTRHNT